MKNNSAFMIRLPEKRNIQIAEVAAVLGTSKAGVIRMSVTRFLAEKTTKKLLENSIDEE